MQAVTFSQKGMKSEKNEDACLSLPSRGLFVVADGVGGGPAGDFASRAVVETLYAGLAEANLSKQSILAIIERANTVVYEASLQQNRKGMASTLVVCWKLEDQVLFFNVGDSRGYRVRGGRIDRLTRDHTRQVQKAPNVIKQVVTNAIGIKPAISVEVTEYKLELGDLLLLMTDGVSDQLGDEDILSIVSSDNSSLVEKARALVTESERRGGRDDKSVILALNG